MTEATLRRRRRLRRLARLLLLTLSASVVILWAVALGVDAFCTARPPELHADPPVLSVSVRRVGDRSEIAKSWLAERDGILMMHLEGDPFTLGYCNVKLTEHLIKAQEDAFMAILRRFIPSRINQWILKKLVLVRNRDLPSFVKPDHQMEICGLARGYTDYYPEMGPPFHRLLNYHAAHDISHVFMDHPLVGCTSFAAWGRHTPDGRLIIGRNFDFDAGRCFDDNKIVIHFKPDRGLSFISVAWPGMIGVVTGLNEARIAVSVNAAQSADARRIGTPVSLVMRDVMQHASTLEQAVEIIRNSRVFIADAYLLGDGKTGCAVVVEKTPARCSVRRPTGDALICSNHFLSDPLKSDHVNIRHMEDSTSVARYDRLDALVRPHRADLTPAAAVRILRDRRVPPDTPAGLGNPASICTLIATHATVADLTRCIIWVSAGPHQLGAYVPFSVDHFDERPDVPNIPADPLLSDGAYERFRRCRAQLEKAGALLKHNKSKEAVALIEEAAALNPGFYLPHLLLGRIAFQKGKTAEAKRHLENAASHYPPFKSERIEIREMLRRIHAESRTAAP